MAALLSRQQQKQFFRCKVEGIIERQLAVLENFYQQGVLFEEQMKYMAAPLRQQFEKLTEKQTP